MEPQIQILLLSFAYRALTIYIQENNLQDLLNNSLVLLLIKLQQLKKLSLPNRKMNYKVHKRITEENLYTHDIKKIAAKKKGGSEFFFSNTQACFCIEERALIQKQTRPDGNVRKLTCTTLIARRI